MHYRSTYADLGDRLASSEIDALQIAKLGKEYSELGYLMELNETRLNHLNSIADLKTVESEEAQNGPSGQEMIEIAQAERFEIEELLQTTENEIIDKLTPKDEDDNRGAVLEVRAGTGTLQHGLS